MLSQVNNHRKGYRETEAAAKKQDSNPKFTNFI